MTHWKTMRESPSLEDAAHVCYMEGKKFDILLRFRVPGFGVMLGRVSSAHFRSSEFSRCRSRGSLFPTFVTLASR